MPKVNRHGQRVIHNKKIQDSGNCIKREDKENHKDMIGCRPQFLPHIQEAIRIQYSLSLEILSITSVSNTCFMSSETLQFQ